MDRRLAALCQTGVSDPGGRSPTFCERSSQRLAGLRFPPLEFQAKRDVYAHEFDHARGLDDVRDSIDAAFGGKQI